MTGRRTLEAAIAVAMAGGLFPAAGLAAQVSAGTAATVLDPVFIELVRDAGGATADSTQKPADPVRISAGESAVSHTLQESTQRGDERRGVAVELE